MHYIKGSLFKSQIFGGTRDELTDQLKKWFLFADRRGREYVKERGVSGAQQQMVVGDGVGEGGGERGVCLYWFQIRLIYLSFFKT